MRSAPGRIKSHRALERPRHVHIPGTIQRQAFAAFIIRSAPGFGPHKGTARIKFAEKYIPAAIRGVQINATARVEVDCSIEIPGNVNVARFIHHRVERIVIARSAPGGSLLEHRGQRRSFDGNFPRVRQGDQGWQGNEDYADKQD